MDSLLALYRAHPNYVSDKWESYLHCYDELFAPLREKPVAMLEIGVQNGGSLEVWSRYFPNATHLIGCDINSACANLRHADPRVKVLVADASRPEALAAVLMQHTEYDIIIDDGSHRSSDIVRSFALFFPHLKDGGIYIAEDLHCSYWAQFEGGLFDQTSSVSFFKRLVDAINFEHWGYAADPASILDEFRGKYGATISAETLSHIHSVAFQNSVCIVRKEKPARNTLGPRTVAGTVELVAQGHPPLNGTAARAIAQDPARAAKDPIAMLRDLAGRG